ncbi:MAG: M20 family metallopeptidase [Candidatus Aminicenantes bacterium]|nr:M20 family metallopeptidase [Candidatus Aminicenantes bacterium]
MKNFLYKKIFIFLFVLLLPALSLAIDKKISTEIESLIERYRGEIIRLRRYLHMNPELSNQEVETGRLISSRLISLGFEVKSGVAGNGVVGLLRGYQSGPTIALRADMDALPIQEMLALPFKSLNPGVMHACGHDVHMAIALGTAYVLNDLRHQLKGNIKFIFQPAEEGLSSGEEGGAALMIKEGVLDNPPTRAIFGLHVWPEANVGQIMFSPGIIMASSDWFQLTIKGKGAHGARPQDGVDAIVLASQVVMALQSIASRHIDPTDPIVLTVGKISGGIRSNILADQVILEGTVRTLSEENRQKIPSLITSVVRGLVQPLGGDFTLDYRHLVPFVYNHPELAKLMLPTLIKAVGQENLLDLKPQFVAEDFAFYAQKIPALYFFLGVKNPRETKAAPLHSPYFNPDERSIPVGIRVMSHLLLDCLEKLSSLVTQSENN